MTLVLGATGPTTRTPLETEARTLADGQRDVKRAAPVGASVAPRGAVSRSLVRAERYLAMGTTRNATLEKAAEWFLDNYYLIRRVARQVEKELPRGFLHHLPLLTVGPASGGPRVEALATALVTRGPIALDLSILRHFIDAYQTITPLTIAELWALPTMLRAAVLRQLVQHLAALRVPVHARTGTRRRGRTARRPGDPPDASEFEAAAGVEQTVRALRVLDVIDWKHFFEQTSRVEAILRTDPAQVYATMDFESCDAYRKVVEQLAWGMGGTEETVATVAVALAQGGAANGRTGLVGYYLVAEGRAQLEAQLGYRPRGLERLRRWVTRWPTTAYLVPLAVGTWAPLIALALTFGESARAPGGTLWPVVGALFLAVVPMSALVVALLQLLFTRLLPPRSLSKLDFAAGLPATARTLVVIPALLGRPADVTSLVRQLELHYLSNPDPELRFALLTDGLDRTESRHGAEDEPLIEGASREIAKLNARHGREGQGPFHLLHRTPRWNPAEERFMGWERKRGKLDELNRLLRGDTQTSYSLHVGDPAGLVDVRFVITLDSDTELPMGSARQLVGLLAHPLNRAVFDPATDRVVAGYTIVQPRVETSPSAPRATTFSRVFGGDVGFDIYTHACSDLYQDLFGAGIYVGKGIYDVDGFKRSVERRAPENALVSHDLFEGIHGRTALASDVVLFESYPTTYASYALRKHRWVRGDWQLLPWLLATVPSAENGRIWNKLPFIDQWKIIDNLRRSLEGPLLLALLILGWTCLPGNAFLWTIAALALLGAPAYPALLGSRRARLHALGRWALAAAFLAHDAALVLDAVGRVLVRKTITGKRLLEWSSATQTAQRLEGRALRSVCWRAMLVSPILAALVATLVLLVRPAALPAAAPVLLLWLLAPEIACALSRQRGPEAAPLAEDERRKLRSLARRTWHFFDVFVGPGDQWLPIDNHQEDPREQTAHRTSPTNMGLLFTATLAAYDFGYLGPSELSLRVRLAFDSIGRMAHYQGHLFNWYETKGLQPLLPRYVSTVDSGNLAGCLLALKQGLIDVTTQAVVRAASWDGLRDSIDLLEEVVSSVPQGAPAPLIAVMERMKDAAVRARENPETTYDTVRTLCDYTASELDRELLAVLEFGAARHEADLLRSLRTSVDRLHQQLQQMRRELDALLPWLALRADAEELSFVLPSKLRLDEIPAAARRLRVELEALGVARHKRGDRSPAHDAAAHRLDEAFQHAEANAMSLVSELLSVAERADDEVRGMDFKLLYDAERRLFHIGYNATTDELDAHYYDLLASEARLASFLAIVKGDAPEAHWFALGRPLTRVDGAPALLSWGGTMFEYLMPTLLMRAQPETLLARTSALAVDAQIHYARANREPWGVSESAFARVDAEHTYQYRSFGVPGLGFKRGMEEDHVVAPYASFLAMSLRPRAVFQNLLELETMGMLGRYGLFEALDLTPERQLAGAPGARPFTVVRSYMAHHQGMLLVALDNYLNDQVMVERFHADALVETGSALLNERSPEVAPAEWPVSDTAALRGAEEHLAAPHAPEPWTPADQAGPQAFLLSNGRLSSLLTASGGGGLTWKGLALTRYAPDVTCDRDGLWLFVRDEESHCVWRATSSEGRTTYAMHKAEFHLRNEGISVHVEVAIASVDDVEVRQVTLRNETDRPRRLSLTSAGAPVLLDARKAPTHPAFSSMFVESERIADLDGLLFTRRAQSAEEEPVALVHRLVREGAAAQFGGFESDRDAFFGRRSVPTGPSALLDDEGALRGHAGTLIDPVMALMAQIELEPRGTVTLAFVTTVGRTRAAALELARKYGSLHAVRWAFHDAENESSRRLQRNKLAPALVPVVQRLFSAIHFAHPGLRAAPALRRATPPSQRRLWARGVSGDDPIVLVRVQDASAPLLDEVIAAQRFLRWCGARFELVLLDEKPSSYATEGEGTLRQTLFRNEVDDWLSRRGGIFILSVDRLSEGDLLHLEACARVLLDTKDGSLATRLDLRIDGPPRLPRMEHTLTDDTEPKRRPRPKLSFEHDAGGFTEDGREYVIDSPPGTSTPAPWCNVLANPRFGCLVSESSLGVTWSENAGENRLTPWRNDPVFDLPSEVLYLRDEETAVLWSPTPLPAGRDEPTLVRHGAGYTVYERESHGLVQELTVFVPPNAPLKVIRLRLTNTLPRHRRLTATYYAEWVLGTQRETQRPHIVSERGPGQPCLLATCSWNAEHEEPVAFLASREEMHGFTCDRAEFLGPRGDYAHPEALERWGLSGRADLGADPCAALQVHLELGRGETLETHFVLGQAATREEALSLVARYRDGAMIESSWQGLLAHWNDLLGKVRVKTPEPSMDLLLNRWLLYQTLSARLFGRTGYYQSSGAFGFRDQLQDVLALFHSAPELARAHILEAARHQFELGDVLHWWHPPSGRGVRTRCSDDLAWLPFVTGEYVRATGDAGILDESLPFLDGAPLAPDEHDRYAEYPSTATTATLLEHCRRAIEFSVTRGAHGLPLMGDGDWNDGMNRIGAEGRGESVWLGWFLCGAMDRFAALATRTGAAEQAAKWASVSGELRETLRKVAWDGGWYLRAFHDDGSRVGSAKSLECRIDSIAQSWSVLSVPEGLAVDARANTAVLAADDQLVRERERLVRLFWPPFDSTSHDPGYVRAYPPGLRENGGQYTHAATWLGFAHVGLGDGARAERLFRLLNPVLRGRSAAELARYRVEPYVLAADVYSCAPWVGRGGWTWYTGAAAWMWRLGVEAILGLRLEEGQLRISPCIPPSWPGFEAWVHVDRQVVHVVVQNVASTGGAERTTMTLDGVAVSPPLLRVDPQGTGTREVVMRLGGGPAAPQLS